MSTNPSLSKRNSRNELLFGAEGQENIAATTVVIIGLGGLGSHVAQQLAYLGVKKFYLVDFDVVSETSLNRLVGAAEEDINLKTKKILVAERTIKSINHESIVELVDSKLAQPSGLSSIEKADVVFGCLDRDLHRLKLNELCAQYNKVYFDLATDINVEGQTYGGRVIFCDGSQCLACLPEIIDQRQVALDRMNPQQREAYAKIYGISKSALKKSGPAVVSINGVVASLAVTEFMVHITGLREPRSLLTYRGDLGMVRPSVDQAEEGCYFCGHRNQNRGLSNFFGV